MSAESSPWRPATGDVNDIITVGMRVESDFIVTSACEAAGSVPDRPSANSVCHADDRVHRLFQASLFAQNPPADRQVIGDGDSGKLTEMCFMARNMPTRTARARTGAGWHSKARFNYKRWIRNEQFRESRPSVSGFAQGGIVDIAPCVPAMECGQVGRSQLRASARMAPGPIEPGYARHFAGRVKSVCVRQR